MDGQVRVEVPFFGRCVYLLDSLIGWFPARWFTFAGLAVRLQGVTSRTRTQVAALRVLTQEVTRLGGLRALVRV